MAAAADVEKAPRCGAKRRGKSKTCGHIAGFGTEHVGYGNCKFHGGNTPSGKQHAAKEMANHLTKQYGEPIEIDPHTALLEELHRTAGHVAFLQDLIARKDESGLTQATGGGQGGIPEDKPSVWLVLYEKERKHFAAVAKACIDAGIEERKVRLAEQEGQLIAEKIRGILEDLGVADDPRAPMVIRRRLLEAVA